MQCKKCDNKIEKGEEFCKSCEPITEQMAIKHNDLVSSESNLGNTSKKIGIVCLSLVLIFQILIIPVAIVGLVLGLKAKKETGLKNKGILFNTISLVVAIPIFIIYFNFLFNPINPIVGTWNCKSYGNSKESSNYVVTLKLNRNNTFVWNKYGDEKNNYIKGKFEYKYVNKENNSNGYFYYSITLNSEEFVEDGKLQTNKYKSQYEMGVGTALSKTRGMAVLINVSSYNMYYCYMKK